MNKFIYTVFSLIFLVSCSNKDMFKAGPVVEEKGEPGLFSKDSKKGVSITSLFSPKENNSGINVNGYLWRASLNVLSIAPLVSTDAFGGTIVTDWYANKKLKNQRIKISAFISTSELRSEGIQVKVHLQNLVDGKWSDTVTDKNLETLIENNILNEARNLRISSIKK